LTLHVSSGNEKLDEMRFHYVKNISTLSKEFKIIKQSIKIIFVLGINIYIHTLPLRKRVLKEFERTNYKCTYSAI